MIPINQNSNTSSAKTNTGSRSFFQKDQPHWTHGVTPLWSFQFSADTPTLLQQRMQRTPAIRKFFDNPKVTSQHLLSGQHIKLAPLIVRRIERKGIFMSECYCNNSKKSFVILYPKSIDNSNIL